MSSITRQSYSTTKRMIYELEARLYQEMEYCKQSLSSGKVISEAFWMQFEEDVKCAYQTIVNLTEILEEEWSNTSKLEVFIKNLEMTNADLFEENIQNISKLEESENQRVELTKMLAQISKNLQIQREAQLSKQKNHSKSIQQEDFSNHNELHIDYLKFEDKIQKLTLQNCRLEEEVFLKQTQIDLAMLIIEDLRTDKQKLVSICSTAYQEKQDLNPLSSPLNSLKSIEIQSASDHKNTTKRSSLLQDLTESQIIYQPRIDSKMFKSTQTIQETVEDNQETTNMRFASRFDAFCKKSKAVSVRIAPDVNDAQTQTSKQPLWFYEKFYGLFKNKIVSQRIRR